MSKQFVTTLIEEMLQEVDYKTVRTGLDKKKHLVTLDVESLSKAFKDSYNRLAEKNPRFTDPSGWKLFNTSAKAAITMVKQECKNSNKSSLTEAFSTLNNPDKVTFYVSRGSHPIFKGIKREFSLRLSRKLKASGEARLTNAYDMKQANPKMHWGAAAKASEIGQLNSGVEIHHKESTTVGIGQLNKALAFLDVPKGFEGFSSSAEVSSLTFLFGNFDAKISWDTNLKDFVLKEDAAIEVGIGSYKDNFGGSEPLDWKKIKPALLNAIQSWASKQDWWNMPGSNSLKEDSEASIGHEIAKELAKASNVKIVNTSAKPNRKKSPVNRKPSKSSKSFNAGSKNPRKYTKVVNTAPMNIGMLLGVLNQRITKQVASNMKSPALNYRTGRFAESVQITDIVRTPQGFYSAGYTYQKNPYQTFEPGFAQGTPDRDPRRLIDKSIREIAVEFAIGRFYTRRV